MPEELSSPERADWVLHHPLDAWVTWSCLGTGVALAATAVHLLQTPNPSSGGGSRQTGTDRTLTALAIGAVVAIVFVARDLSWVTAARPQGYERLIQLFVYRYDRPWPDHLDYRPILTGFAIVSTALVALCVLPVARRYASRALVGLAVAWAAWCLNVYMVDLSPHWGQRELVKRYYELREDAAEPLVAWQMNWKGENFYSGNRVAVFVDLDNTAIRQWNRRA